MDEIFLLPFGTPISKYKITEEIKEGLFMITQSFVTGEMQELITSCSTGITTIFADSVATSVEGILIKNDDELVEAVSSKKYDTFKRHGSPYQGYLSRGKKELIDNILSKNFPNIEDKEVVIFLLGGALNKQVDKTYKSGNITMKIKNLLDDSTRHPKYNYYTVLQEKYEKLNPFYNTCKHEGDDVNTRYEELLNKKEGRLITIHFYETVRRIFEWYYEIHSKEGIPTWEHLKQPDYKGLYDFDTYQLPII